MFLIVCKYFGSVQIKSVTDDARMMLRGPVPVVGGPAFSAHIAANLCGCRRTIDFF